MGRFSKWSIVPVVGGKSGVSLRVSPFAIHRSALREPLIFLNKCIHFVWRSILSHLYARVGGNKTIFSRGEGACNYRSNGQRFSLTRFIRINCHVT